MSEDKTAETGGSRPFEERVFARFDAMDDKLDRVDARLDRVELRMGSIESRIEKLEAKQYDTKPIWEQALAAIAETNRAMSEGFDKLRTEIDAALRGVGRKIEVLNQNILELRADQRYFESRLEKLEPQ